MARELLSPIGVLDETPSAVTRVAAPWLGVLWPALLPLRFLQAHFARDLFQLGTRAEEYGTALTGLAITTFAAFLLSVWGRAVYVRAVRLGLQSGRRVGREALKVPAHELANLVYASLLFEVLFYASVWLFFPVPFVLLLSGLAFASIHRTERPGLLRPLKETVSLLGHPRLSLALFFTFGLAFLVTYINLYVAARLILWAAGTLLGSDLPRWIHLLRPMPWVPVFPAEPLSFFVLLAGAMLVVEPFWLAALSVCVHRSRLRETGEDLRLRFRQITQAKP